MQSLSLARSAPAAPRTAARAAPVARPASRPFAVPRQQQRLARKAVVLAADATKAGAGAVNDQTWEELVLNSPLPVLIDFWAPWCGPCRMIAPLIDELAAEYDGRLRTLKLNTDESPNVATELGIRSIPTVMVFKGGKKMDAVIGAVPKGTLVQTIEKYLD